MGRGTFVVVSDGSGSLRRGPGQVGGPTRASGTFWGTLPMVQDKSGILEEVRHGSRDPRGS